jgi:hypothetical protein
LSLSSLDALGRAYLRKRRKVQSFGSTSHVFTGAQLLVRSTSLFLPADSAAGRISNERSPLSAIGKTFFVANYSGRLRLSPIEAPSQSTAEMRTLAVGVTGRTVRRR